MEVLLAALALQALALLATRAGLPPPWPELLALGSEHSLWLLGALRLRPSTGPVWWRMARVPLFGALAGLGFAWLGRELALALPPARAFFEFQALAAPDPARAVGPGLGSLVLTACLRFVFAYGFRAVWLEGRLRLRWRLTALALGGGVLASALVAILPDLASLATDPARGTAPRALREARDLATRLGPGLGIGLDERQLGSLLAVLEGERTIPPPAVGPRPDPAAPAAEPGRAAYLLRPDGRVVAASPRDASGLPEAAALEGPLATVRTGRCRTDPVGPGALALCPVFAPGGAVEAVAAVLQPASDAVPAAADLVGQLARDLTVVLDTLSRSFLPIFLGIGLLGYLAARRLTGRLETLLGGAGALSAGALGERVPVEGEDEIAGLAVGFNRMADRLEENLGDLEREKERAEGLLRANRTLTASASHELRTPIAVMRAHLESAELRRTPLGPEEARVLEAEVRRLERLVEDLFALSRAELGRLELRFEAVNPAEAVAALADAVGPLAAASRVTLVRQVEEDLPRARADRARLHQALLNLAQNALRYTPEGGLVKLGARAEGGGVVFSVADTGIGISPEDIPHVFEPFYRADPARARETGGSGLGLALVREVVEAMGGRATAESEPGKGSRFALELPAWEDGPGEEG